MYRLFSLVAQVTAIFLVTICVAGMAEATDLEKAFENIITEPLPEKVKIARLDGFVQRFGTRSLKFLANQASKYEKSKTGRLAVIAIGSVGGPPAVETLSRLIRDHRSSYAQFMILTLADIQEPEASEQLRQLAATEGLPEHRIAAAVALRWRGDAGDIERLKTAAVSTKSRLVRLHLLSAAEAVEYRLMLLPEGVSPQEWSAYQRSFWSEVMNPPQLRSLDAAYRASAANVVEKGELPRVFLRRFNGEEIESAQLVAVQIMGMQKQAEDVPHFYGLAQRSDSLGRAGLSALIDVGNEEAVRLLGELLARYSNEWPSMAVEGLVTIGTAQAAEVLERAAGITADQDLAGYCRRAAVRIRKKL